jgi:formamidopyrimidine-DNA glycosylase
LPEYPDITIYIERLDDLLRGRAVQGVRVVSPFVMRTAIPPIDGLIGCEVLGFERVGKRIVFVFTDDLLLVAHLMIAGRLHWRPAGAAIPRKGGLAAFDFEHGTLLMTESGTKKRASLHLLEGREALRAIDPGGLEVVEADEAQFGEALTRENRTLKRALTDPRILSGIGNAYSDEILHRARLSPVKLTRSLTDGEKSNLFNAIREVLAWWTDSMREDVGDGFPERVTAFREGMAVHGRFGEPCPDCGSAVQRIRYESRETNYCATCQTGRRLLADRVLSRLLKKDWPRTLEELEELKRPDANGPRQPNQPGQ